MQSLCHLSTTNGAPLLNTSLRRKIDRGLCCTISGSSTFTELFSKKGFWGKNNLEKKNDLSVRAMWRFLGGGGIKSTNPRIEDSTKVFMDVVIFLSESTDKRAKKRSSKREAQDKEIKILTLRARIEKAIETENYDLAAKLHDQVSTLEGEAWTASAKALAFENVKCAFRLGQHVQHKVFGYIAVICGMDPVCCESKSWMEKANIDKLSQGPNQPFYKVLVDNKSGAKMLVAYVAEENLLAIEEQDKARFVHIYIPYLFCGIDTAGDFIPTIELCDKFGQPHPEPPYEQNDDDSNGDA